MTYFVYGPKRSEAKGSEGKANQADQDSYDDLDAGPPSASTAVAAQEFATYYDGDRP